MQKKKIRLGMDSALLLGLIFGFIGIIYLPVGIGLGIALPDGRLFLCIFGGLGAVFLIVSAALIVRSILCRRGIRRAVEDGQYVLAAVTEVTRNYNVRVNGRHPVYAVCAYTEPLSKTVHLYRSRERRYIPDDIVGQTVKVYISRENDKYYYADIDEILPKVIEH